MEVLDSYYESGDLLVRLWRDARKEVVKDKYAVVTLAGRCRTAFRRTTGTALHSGCARPHEQPPHTVVATSR
ncbi:hypothetical protein GCM10010384_39350 [Streptomyces djakartensis]|uniref:Uncharacterized protein n=1 Tax=Streptomyces djakartensis TaxID=68193 RepID=A0ABQ2ZY98_9ACTN|nr:hypothetical protein GCM10010384_39350 [Streptomyces djakartensis]